MVASDDGSARAPSRKQLGAWYTPIGLVDTMVEQGVGADFLVRRAATRRVVRVLDPACGDGRFLSAVARLAARVGVPVELVGVDVDASAARAARRSVPDAVIVEADALEREWDDTPFDLVIGNPPFLSQMSTATTRGGPGGRGGGAYADTAVEFLALAGELVDPAGGRVVFVLPQSVLSARDARDVRRGIDRRSVMHWSWWTGERVFDAQVLTCALGFEFAPRAPAVASGEPAGDSSWSSVVTARQGVPSLPELRTDGTVSDRAVLNANFRDEYYGMAPAVGDHPRGPRLVTSGLIDPGRSWWGVRPVTFARTRFDAPRIDIEALDGKMKQWAERRLVPKVLVANQTSIVEAVCDEHGEWLPAVPVIGIYPDGGPGRPSTEKAWEIAALLTSPVASAWMWHRNAGTGLSANSIRLGPVVLGELPWPAGPLDDAVAALREGSVRECGYATNVAYGIGDGAVAAELVSWWGAALQRIERRSPAGSAAGATAGPVSRRSSTTGRVR